MYIVVLFRWECCRWHWLQSSLVSVISIYTLHVQGLVSSSDLSLTLLSSPFSYSILIRILKIIHAHTPSLLPFHSNQHHHHPHSHCRKPTLSQFVFFCAYPLPLFSHCPHSPTLNCQSQRHYVRRRNEQHAAPVADIRGQREDDREWRGKSESSAVVSRRHRCPPHLATDMNINTNTGNRIRNATDSPLDSSQLHLGRASGRSCSFMAFPPRRDVPEASVMLAFDSL